MIVHDFLMIVVHLLHSANSSILLVAEGEPIEFSLPGIRIKNIYARYSAVFLLYTNPSICQNKQQSRVETDSGGLAYEKQGYGCCCRSKIEQHFRFEVIALHE